MDLTKPSGVLLRLYKKAPYKYSQDSFLSKLPHVDTSKLYKEQSESINRGDKELRYVDEGFSRGEEPQNIPKGNKNTPAVGGKPIAPLAPPEMPSPQFAVAPPSGNVDPRQRTVPDNSQG